MIQVIVEWRYRIKLVEVYKCSLCSCYTTAATNTASAYENLIVIFSCCCCFSQSNAHIDKLHACNTKQTKPTKTKNMEKKIVSSLEKKKKKNYKIKIFSRFKATKSLQGCVRGFVYFHRQLCPTKTF